MDKHPFTFKTGFKVACGAYLGWGVMQGIDRAIGTRLARRFGSADELIEKIHNWGEKEKS